MRRRSAVCVALSLLSLVSISHAALISSPFDNFRIECPQNAGAQRLSIRMVESQGMKRQDTVFAISCTNVNELYPWNGIPQDLAELERENCRYSESFDPIMDRSTNFSCGPREYVASVVRLFGTKIQIGCCKLRTRDETNCVEQRFGKPFGVNIRSEIENQGMLINAIAIDGHYLRVRFCDLTPRAAGLIEEDARVEAARRTTLATTTTSTLPPTTASSTTIFTTQVVTDEAEIETTSMATSPKKVIKVKQPNAKVRGQIDGNQAVLNTLPVETNESETTTLIAGHSLSVEQEITTPSSIASLKPAEEEEKLDVVDQDLQPLRPIHGTSIVAGSPNDQPGSGLDGLDSLNEPTFVSESPSDNTTAAASSEPSSASTEILASSASSVQQTSASEEQTTSSASTESVAATSSSTVEQTTSTTTEVPTTSSSSNAPPTTEAKAETSESTSQPSSSSTSPPTTSTAFPSSSSTTEQPATTTIGSKLHEHDAATPASTPAASSSTTESIHTTSTTQRPANESIAAKKEESGTDFAATDTKGTETMFPQAAMDDYDEEGSEQKQVDAMKNSIDQLMKTQTAMEELTKELEQKGELSAAQANLANKLLSTPVGTQNATDGQPPKQPLLHEGSAIKKEEKPKEAIRANVHEHNVKAQTADPAIDFDLPTTAPSVETNQIVSSTIVPPPHQRRGKIADGHTNIARRPETAADEPFEDDEEGTTSSRPLERQQKPKVASKKIDETSNDAPFDFDAFPSPPPESTAGTPTSTAPSRLQTKQTTPTTTPEPDYLVADDLSEVPESVRSHPRRKFQPARGSSIRRRPVATSPYVDEETISSPFDVGTDGEKQPAKGPNGRNRKVEALPGDDAQADAFDRADNFEQPEGRFSLPETRFNQRSPFDPPGEIRRAPTPHLSEPFAYNLIDKLPRKEPSRSVDIVFQTPFEEPIAMPPIAEIGHRDGERFYTPPENKPMPVPTPDMTPKEEVHFEAKAVPSQSEQVVVAMPVQERQPIAPVEQPNQLVPMEEPSPSPPTELPTSTSSIQTSSETAPPAATESSTSTLPPTTSTTPAAPVVVEERAPAVELIEANETPPPTPAYNPLHFYHTIQPRRGFLKEKVLTFCTKDSAIRDQNNMVIACGVESDVWVPNRCPAGTDCFSSNDSLYRICCPVGSR